MTQRNNVALDAYSLWRTALDIAEIEGLGWSCSSGIWRKSFGLHIPAIYATPWKYGLKLNDGFAWEIRIRKDVDTSVDISYRDTLWEAVQYVEDHFASDLEKLSRSLPSEG